jgi:hypothetical protein
MRISSANKGSRRVDTGKGGVAAGAGRGGWSVRSPHDARITGGGLDRECGEFGIVPLVGH